MRTKILIIYGASTKLAFIDQFLRDEFRTNMDVNIVYFGHHASWYSGAWYRYLLNTIHILKLIVRILLLAPNSKIVIFGTNAARILFPFLFYSNAYVIFNELPALEKKKLLYAYDRFIIGKFQKVYLSSAERVELVMKLYNLKRYIGVVNNIPKLNNIINHTTGRLRNGFIYSGLISSGRFSGANKKLKKLSVVSKERIDFFGWKAFGFELDQRFFDFKGNISHDEILKILGNYKFAILQYSQLDYNNEFCAPIKIYEYLSNGCIILSVNKNLGLKRLERKYPGIIYFLDDLEVNLSADALKQLKFNNKSAQRCLDDASQTNTKFVLDVLDDV